MSGKSFVLTAVEAASASYGEAGRPWKGSRSLGFLRDDDCEGNGVFCCNAVPCTVVRAALALLWLERNHLVVNKTWWIKLYISLVNGLRSF